MPGTLNPVGFFVGDQGPTVSASSSNVTRGPAALNPVYAGVAYNATGFEFSNNASGSNSYDVSRGLWLDSGSASEVWLERTINSGSLNSSDPGAGRHQLNTARLLEVSDSTILGGAVTCNVTVDFYDASTGGNLLDSVTYTLSAERESGG